MKKINKYAVGTALGISLLLPLLAMAQISGPPGPLITSPKDISTIIIAVFNWLGGIVFTISLIMLIYAAILYMTAGASETTLAKSKTVLIYAIVGLAVAILTYSFRPFIETFFSGRF